MIKVKTNRFLLENVLATLLASTLSISVVTTLNIFNITINEYISIIMIFVIPVFALHGFYYLDNGGVKNTLGRIRQDVLFISILFLLSYLSLSITNQFHRIGSSLNLLSIIFFSTILSELIFTCTIGLLLKIKRR